MDKFIAAADRTSAAVGKVFAWSIVVLTLTTSYDVAARYLFDAPTVWAFDVSTMLYGSLFMMCGAYTLSQGGHVRGDSLYRLLPVRVQASLDAALYVLFFLPGVLALVWFGWDYAARSWRIGERSMLSPSGPPIYHFKTVIPVAAGFMLLQGIAEFLRCLQAIRRGRWPSRVVEVREKGESL